MNKRWELKSTIKHPTSLIINGVNAVGLELANSLMEQGGYVVVIDAYTQESTQQILEKIDQQALFTFLDYSSIAHLDEDLRRLDYVFYLNHKSSDLLAEVSSQEFLKQSNYLDTVLAVSAKFTSKFLLTTSVKANQLQLASMDLEVNFGAKSNKKHLVYTQMELQRYSEGLVLEYTQKTSLDSRIIRLGEIVGTDIDLSLKSSVNSLIQQAVSGQDLVLSNDGLQDNWFINSTDAVYALIKAQFSKDTVGEIFTAAYDQPVTDLSLAYKLQEIEPLAREISFTTDDKTYLPLRVYKPAPSLQSIGWKPKYTLEESLKDSVVKIKLDILVKPEGANDLASKIRSFLNVSQSADTSDLEIESSGPIARLILERKKQDQARAISIDAANTKVKTKFSARQLTFSQKINRWLWTNILNPATNFGPLRKLTLVQSVLAIIFLFVFTILYFQVISPVAVIARNLVITSIELNNIKQLASANPVNYTKLYNSSNTISKAVAEIKQKVLDFDALANLVAAGKTTQEVNSRLQVVADLAAGVANLAYSQIPVNQYLTEYSDNIRFRANKDNYLAASAATDYSNVLDEITIRAAYAQLGTEQVNNVNKELVNLNSTLLPQTLVDQFNTLVAELQKYGSTESAYNTSKYISQVLGYGTAKSYAIVITDNSRPMPLGGDILGVVQITTQNGGITEVKSQSIETLQLDLKTLGSFYSTAGSLSNLNSLTLTTTSDLANLPDVKTLYQALQSLWQSQLSRNLDGVVVMNIEALSKLLNITGPVDLEGQQVSAAELLSDLSSLQTPTPTINRRADLAMQVTSKIIDVLWDNISVNYSALMQQFVDSVFNKDILIYTPELELNKLLNKKGINSTLETASFVILPTFVRNADIISPTRFPGYTQRINASITAQKTFVATMALSFPGINNLDQAGLCVSKIAKGLSVSNIPSSRQVTKTSGDYKCITVKLAGETELVFAWDTVPFENSDINEYNFGVAFAKQSGNQVVSDLELQVDPGSLISKVDPTQQIDKGKLAFSINLLMDQIIKLSIIKN